MTAPLRMSLALALTGTLAICDPDLRCTPKNLHPGDKLTIAGLPLDHKGWTFTINGANGTATLVVSSLKRKSDKFAPPISPEAFGKLTKVILDVSNAKGIPFGEGKASARPTLIFEKSDKYEIVVGAPLGSEDTDTYTCEVEFSTDPATPGKSDSQPSNRAPH